MSALATRTANPIASITPNMDIATMGKYFADSGFFKDSRSVAQAIVKIKAGEELGIPPVAAMTGIYIVKDKVMVGAHILASAVEKSGRYSYKVLQLDDKGCRLHFFKDGQPSGISEFGVKDATAAGLMANHNYKAYPRNMYFSRAMSNGVKWYCAGVFSGPVYTPEELGVPTNAAGDPIVNEEGEVPTSRPVAGRRTSALDIIDSDTPPSPQSAAPPEDVTGSERPETPGGGEVEPPLCGYSDPNDFRSAFVEAAVKRGFAVARAGQGHDTFMSKGNTPERRAELWANLHRGDLDRHK